MRPLQRLIRAFSRCLITDNRVITILVFLLLGFSNFLSLLSLPRGLREIKNLLVHYFEYSIVANGAIACLCSLCSAHVVPRVCNQCYAVSICFLFVVALH